MRLGGLTRNPAEISRETEAPQQGMRNVTQEEKQKIPAQRVEAFFPQNASSFFPGQHPRAYLYCTNTGLVCTQCVTFSPTLTSLITSLVSQGPKAECPSAESDWFRLSFNHSVAASDWCCRNRTVSR